MEPDRIMLHFLLFALQPTVTGEQAVEGAQTWLLYFSNSTLMIAE